MNPQKSQYYAVQATKHQNIALPMYRHESANMSAQNCDAVFAFGAFLIVHALASSSVSFALSGGRSHQDREIKSAEAEVADRMANEAPDNEDLPEWIYMLRGVSVLTKDVSMFDGTTVAPLLDIERFKNRVISSTDEIYLDALNNLFNHAHASPPESDIVTYKQALNSLRTAFTTPSPTFSPHLPNRPIPYMFFTTVNERYLHLVKQKEPEALVLMAYACVSLKRIEPLWFFDGVADGLLRRVLDGLSEEWLAWVEWPLRETGLK